MRARGRSGFTLVEMLVVIAIIVTLAGLLLPAIMAAKDASKTTQCMSNLRQLGMAINQYQDHFKCYPPYRFEDPTVFNKYGVQRPRWQWIMADFMGRFAQNPNAVGAAVAADATCTLVPLDNEILVCPAMTSGPDSLSIRNGSYGYNFQYLGNSRNLVDGDLTTPAINYPVPTVKDPAHTIAFGDSRGGSIPHGGHSMTLDPPHMRVHQGVTVNTPYWTQAPFTVAIPNIDPYGPDEGTADITVPFSPAEARHRGKANVVFLDGHGESLTLQALGYHLNAAGVPQLQTTATPLAGSDNSRWTGRGLDEYSTYYGTD